MVEKKREGEVAVHKPIPTEAESLTVVPGVTIIVTQAFCPQGHNLVRDEDAHFDGYPGVTVYVEAAGWEGGEVTLSPIHGDHSKIGMPRQIPEGTKCTIRCPECEEILPTISKCGCENDGDLVAIYLRKSLNEGDVIAICNVLGCYRSRIMDNFDLLSEFVEKDSGE